MEKGNEGDEIILLSIFQQIDCSSITNDIKKVNQITADILVDIIIKSLFLISDGNIQVNNLIMLYTYIFIYIILTLYKHLSTLDLYLSSNCLSKTLY